MIAASPCRLRHVQTLHGGMANLFLLDWRAFDCISTSCDSHVPAKYFPLEKWNHSLLNKNTNDYKFAPVLLFFFSNINSARVGMANKGSTSPNRTLPSLFESAIKFSLQCFPCLVWRKAISSYSLLTDSIHRNQLQKKVDAANLWPVYFYSPLSRRYSR